MDCLAFVEQRGGKIRSAGWEALSAARRLCDKIGGKLTALVVGDGITDAAGEAAKYGAERTLVVDRPELGGFVPEAYLEAVMAAVQTTEAKVVVLAATVMGRALGAMTAAQLEAGILPDCISLDFQEGRIIAHRPVYAGRCIMTLASVGLPLVVTVRPKAFPALIRDNAPVAPERLIIELNGKIKSQLLETRATSAGKLDVSEADIVVSGGRGLKGPENFQLLEDLAATLGAAVGASRAVVDAGWRPHSEQVGQTGKVVSPTLYIAAGISGAIQHLAGMRTAKVIVAVNKDPEAPIFKTADYGIVGDALEVLPVLTEKIKSLNR